MKSAPPLLLLTALGAAPQAAWAQHAAIDELVAVHAKTYDVPEALVHRVIVRESKYQPHLIGQGGAMGLMQIKLATARSLGFTGTAEELRDPDTNLMYGIKYLAGAYRLANGDYRKSIRHYAKGYYYAAKERLLNATASIPLPRSRPSAFAEAFSHFEKR